MDSNPETKLEYYFANIVANGWLNIEYDEHPFYWVKGNISLSTFVVKNKVQNKLIGYLQGQKRNLSIRISKLNETWTQLNLKAIQSIFYPNQLHTCCHLPEEVVDYLYRRLNNAKEKFIKYGENKFYTNTCPVGEIQVVWKNEFTQSIASRTVSAEALMEWKNGSVLGMSTWRIVM